ncbi:MAG: GNAT family N-acetyltransferase [Pyrinomonadaceae bacterium]|nr:GNAT family N-acetyltransferase [Pyrinomonadaceae bacterium]
MEEIDIRECVTIEELDQCVRLQREVFGLRDLEISPRRHLIVSREAGGWTLGAFTNHSRNRIVGFVHHLVAVRGEDEVFGYSHMMAVHKDYQNLGLGARLKWAQRERALGEGRRFIKWTWEPMQARNAHFNLNRLGVVVRTYAENFYGTDYMTDPAQQSPAAHGLPSDRLFAGWELSSPRVIALAGGGEPAPPPAPAAAIEIPPDWTDLIKRDVNLAKHEQLRVRREFEQAFSAGLVCARFERSTTHPRYLLYNETV